MTWLTVGMMFLGALIGVGLALMVSDIVVRILPVLLIAAGMACAYYVVTTTADLPSWLMQEWLKSLTHTWYGALLLGGLGSLSAAFAVFPLTAVVNVREDLNGRTSDLSRLSRRVDENRLDGLGGFSDVRAEISSLARRVAELEKSQTASQSS